MILSDADRRSINAAALNAARAKASGLDYTAEEIALIKRYHPDIDKLRELMPNRSRHSITTRAGKLGLAKKLHVWTDRELKTLRTLWAKPGVTRAELETALPNVGSYDRISAKASTLKLRRVKPAHAPTGVPILDEILKEARRLNLSLVDLDKMARSTPYFHDRRWRGNEKRKRPPWVCWTYIMSIAEQLGATVSITFPKD